MPSNDLARPRLSVLTPAMSRETLPIAAQIRMSEGEHQIATLTVLTPLSRDRQVLDASVPASIVLPEGTPVSFLFGSSAADTAVWYGYVASRQVQSTKAQHGNPASPVVPVVYTLTGISMPMQSAAGRAYAGISASAAARNVIGGYDVAAYIQPHPRIWPTLAQGTLSDFAWLAKLADMVGYRLIVDANRISFADAGVDLTPTTAAVPRYARNVQPGVWDSLIAFDPASGQSDPSGATVSSYTSYAVRPSSGISAVTTHSPPIISGDGTVGAPTFTRVAGGSAQSLSDAQYTAAAKAAASRYWVYAKATVDGNTALRPGRRVQLGGAGLTAADTGFWRVCTVTHAITLSGLGQAFATYYAHMDLGRDQANALNLTAASPALGQAPAMSLSGSRWISPGGGS
jgi:hypothetical protein